jgi:hypothetical protein
MAYQTAEQVTALVLNRKNYKLDKYYIKQDFQRQFFTLNLKKTCYSMLSINRIFFKYRLFCLIV